MEVESLSGTPSSHASPSFGMILVTPAPWRVTVPASFFVDESDVVWVGTRESGLDRIDPVTKRVTHFRHDAGDPVSLSNDSVLAITADRSGKLWIGTEKGINRFDRATGEFTQFGEAPVRSILEDRTGTLWVGTKRAGLLRLDAQGNEVEVFRHDENDPTSLGNDTVRQVLEDSAGRLWVGTHRGLDLLDRADGTFSHYRNDPSDAYQSLERRCHGPLRGPRRTPLGSDEVRWDEPMEPAHLVVRTHRRGS